MKVPHTKFNLKIGHGLRMNTTSLILQMWIGVSSRQFPHPTIIELFGIANESISFNQLKYIINYKCLNYLIVICRDMDHLKSSKYHIIIHPQLTQICQTWFQKQFQAHADKTTENFGSHMTMMACNADALCSRNVLYWITIYFIKGS